MPRILAASSRKFARGGALFFGGLGTSSEFLSKFLLPLTTVQQDEQYFYTDSPPDPTNVLSIRLGAKVTDQRSCVGYSRGQKHPTFS